MDTTMINATTFLMSLPLASSPLIYLLGRLGVQQNIMPRRSRLVRWGAVSVLLLTWLPLLYAVRSVAEYGSANFLIGSIAIQVDGLSVFLASVVLSLSTLVAIYSGRYTAGETGEEKYYAMLLAMTGVMLGLGCSGDLFNLWVWFEAMAVSSYLLVSFYSDEAGSLEAGFKYLVQSAGGSVLVLLGVALVLANTGTLNLADIRTAATTGDPMLFAAGALFLVGFGVKVALVPVHTWLPDAHSQAPSGISAMLSGVVIEAGLVALLRAISPLAGVTPAWGLALMAFAVLNLVVGNFLALRQTQVKRMLAFSSLSHVGYMLVGLGVAFWATAQGLAGDTALQAAAGAFFHLLNHMLMKGLAFLAVGALLYALVTAHGSHAPLTVADLAGAAQRYPLEALTLSIALLSLGGLPPLAGFMSKWQIFVAAFQTEQPLIQALVIFAALNSVLSLAYYAPVVNTLYRGQPSQAVLEGVPLALSLRAPLVLLALAIIILGFWPGLLSGLTQAAAQSLLSGLR